MSEKSISIWCDDIIGYVSVKPIINKYIDKGYKIHFYTRKDALTIAKFAFPEINIYAVQVIDSKFLNILHHLYRIFLTPDNFSWMFSEVVKPPLYGKFLCFISTSLKLYKFNSNFENLYNKFFRISRFKFPSDLVISFSRVSRPYLFNNCKKHIAIVESWDHAIKEPWFFSPRAIMAWNQSIKSNLTKYQKIAPIKKIFPLKFSYIHNDLKLLPESIEVSLEKHYRADINFIENNNYILYSVAFSDVNEEGAYGEFKFINELISVCGELGLFLFIKPKPFGNKGKLKENFQKFDNVYVGQVPLFDGGLELLSNSYNSYRKKLLKNSKILIDIGSTYLIDASLCGANVLMVKPIKKNYSPLFDKIFEDENHLKGHLSDFSHLWYEYNGDIHLLAEKIKSNFSIAAEIKSWMEKW